MPLKRDGYCLSKKEKETRKARKARSLSVDKEMNVEVCQRKTDLRRKNKQNKIKQEEREKNAT